jgi:hypothetical protein
VLKRAVASQGITTVNCLPADIPTRFRCTFIGGGHVETKIINTDAAGESYEEQK